MTARVGAFVAFCVARHQVYVNRVVRGLSKPWTGDPILQAYRFCNVYRELDTVTQWIRQKWSPKLGGHPDAWFWMVVARLVNHPTTLAAAGFDLRREWEGYNDTNFFTIMETRKAQGVKAFGSAYIVSTNGHTMEKHLYLDDHVLTPLWRNKHAYRPTPTDTLASFHKRLITANGLGSFMAAQVVADTKNTHGDHLHTAEDWWTWAAPGPGSMRGLSRVLFQDKDHRFRDAQFLVDLNELQDYVNAAFVKRGWQKLCAQDVQNCLCEFDKYERVRLGQGKPRQRYAGV